MPSPFPGMDPFIESQRFDEFHSVYLMTLGEMLVPLVRPKYTVDIDRYVFLSAENEELRYRPDISIAESTAATSPSVSMRVATMEPRLVAVPETDEESQVFLTIRSRDDQSVITVIELLSPINKDGSTGQLEYLAKRANYLRTLTSIVEIDLLRGGARLPTVPAAPATDYNTLVIRHGDRGRAECYAWNLTDRLPVIPIPLKEPDSDVGLDLQQALNTAYDRHGYDYSLKYNAEIQPLLDATTREWVACVLKRHG